MKQETILWLIDNTVKQISTETEKYTDAIKNNRPFSEAKQIRLKIKSLTEELSSLLSQQELRGNAKSANSAKGEFSQVKV